MPAVNVWVPAELLDAAKAQQIPLSKAIQTALRDTLGFLDDGQPSNSTVREIAELRAEAIARDEG